MAKKGLIVSLVALLLSGGIYLSLTGRVRELETAKTEPVVRDSAATTSPLDNSGPQATEQLRGQMERLLSNRYRQPISAVIEELREKLQIEPDNAGLHYELGEIYLDLGQREEAVEHFRRVLKIRPQSEKREFIEYWIKNIEKKAEVKEVQEDLRRLREEVEKNPGIESYQRLAEFYEKQHPPSMAIKYYREALELSPQNAELHLRVAILSQKDYYPEAMEHFREVLKCDPTHPQREKILEWIGELARRIDEQKYAYEKGNGDEAELISALQVQLSRDSEVQKTSAIRGLAMVKSERATAILRDELGQPHSIRLKREIITALGQNGTRGAWKILESELNEKGDKGSLKGEILGCYARWGSEEEIPVIEKWLAESGTKIFRRQGEQAIHAMKLRLEKK